MNLYNERMCIWCWEYENGDEGDFANVRPAVYTLIMKHADGKTTKGNICASCHDEMLPNMEEDNKVDPWFESFEILPLLVEPIRVFVRGDRVEIVRINRVPMVGTVVHCYLSNRDFSAKVNIVIDGKKWPQVFPAHIVQKWVGGRKVA
jgi:hypothetical protein